MFKVQRKMCETCIYRKSSPLDLERLENEARDDHKGFRVHRVCHHTEGPNEACCKGFWDRHKDDFPMGQISQRLNMVEEVDIDCLT